MPTASKRFARCWQVASCATFAALGTFSSAALSETYLPPIGGPGGGQFTDICATDTNLAGVELRTADDVDAIRPICVQAYSGATNIGPLLHSQRWHGGDGGRVRQLMCPAKTPIVSGIAIATEGVDKIIVNSVSLYCTTNRAQQAPNPYPSAVFEGPAYVPSESAFVVGINGDPAYQGGGREDCPSGQVAVGLHGRSGKWLDAVGLACDFPRITTGQGPVASIGRSAPSSEPKPNLLLCEAAAAARARNSPAAANLEAQCRNQQNAPIPSIGRTPAIGNPGGPPQSICDRAADARDRGSPAAPNLVAQCRNLGGQVPEHAAGGPANREDLLAQGQTMSEGNSLAAALRQLQPEGPGRDGFDIGLAATGVDTAWGPGKQKTLESLPKAQQEGFKLAASLAMDQNRHAELARIGAIINEADPRLARARKREADPRFWLGFDIGAGLMGDPALGSKRNSVTGIEIMGIRDTLAGPAQRGLMASIQLQQTRNY